MTGEKRVVDTIYYVVESIDGDYANLKRTDADTDELKLVARALLPDGIDAGTKLKYEAFEYEVI
jgi:hypothetical protein